jgi:electron transfer flavoprotein alpha subunit
MASKDLIPRLAEALSSGMVSDVVGVISASEFKRPMLAGSVLATVSVINSGSPICLTVRAASFKHVELFQTESVEPLAVEIGKVKVVSASKASATRPDLSQAKVVVSGGKPLKDAVTFERLMGGLADALDGAVGATRAAVDSGIAPNELQVGQTGKVVAPDLYIAAGISGSTQHVAGIKDSKLIVAINKDPDAPIFDVADLGLVADLFEAVPELTAKLSS